MKGDLMQTMKPPQKQNKKLHSETRLGFFFYFRGTLQTVQTLENEKWKGGDDDISS